MPQNTSQPESLYTVLVTFDDFTNGIEQYQAESPEAAMAMFIREAECLSEFPSRDRGVVEALHIAVLEIKSLNGFWVWIMAQSEVPTIPSLLGGHIIRTAQSSVR